MYSYRETDKLMEPLTRKIVREFGKLKRSVLAFDDINKLKNATNECYAACHTATIQTYVKIAKHYYKECGGTGDTVINILFIDLMLNEYDPVTKYIFATEWDRKRARAVESIIGGRNPKDVDTAMKYLHGQIRQWGDEVTDNAVLTAYADKGIKKVKWKTEEDSRVCKECGELNDKIFPIKSVPDKPHIGCRCRLLPLLT